MGVCLKLAAAAAAAAADINHELLRMAEDEELMQVCLCTD